MAGGGQLSLPLTGLVEGTVVHTISFDLIFEHRFQPDYWEESDWDFVIHFINDSAPKFPLSAFNVAATDVDSGIWRMLNAL